MSKLVVAETALEVVRPPEESSMAVHTAEAAEKIAARIKDKRALGIAIEAKVDAQRDFAADYRARFPTSQSTGGRATDLSSGSPADHCRLHGFNLRTVQRWAERFLVDDYEARKEAIKERAFRQVESPSQAHVGHNSGEVEWYTPSDLIEAARGVMGGIDLDPASSAKAQETVRASSYFTREDNGLSKSWHGKVWLNPPYGQPLIDDFVLKLEAELGAGRVEQACVLTNNGTETYWGQTLLSICAAVWFPSGRIKFLSPDGEKATPLQGQMLTYFGPNIQAFLLHFREGVVCLNAGL